MGYQYKTLWFFIFTLILSGCGQYGTDSALSEAQNSNSQIEDQNRVNLYTTINYVKPTFANRTNANNFCRDSYERYATGSSCNSFFAVVGFMSEGNVLTAANSSGIPSNRPVTLLNGSSTVAMNVADLFDSNPAFTYGQFGIAFGGILSGFDSNFNPVDSCRGWSTQENSNTSIVTITGSIADNRWSQSAMACNSSQMSLLCLCWN